MTLHPSSQFPQGGGVPFDRPPVAPAAAEITALSRRLDSVDEELMLADKVLGELVRHLEPVLPVGFGEESRAIDPMDPPTGPSPLASRMADLARRTHDVVRNLQTIAAAVDL